MVAVIENITLSVPSRLHLGFIDLHGGMGRMFGSVGIALAEPRLELEISRAESLAVRGVGSAGVASRVARIVAAFDKHYRLKSLCTITIKQPIAIHAGLGSGTQLALAVGHGLARLHNLVLSSAEIAACLGRGQRSGIGLYAFDKGGVLVDAGVKGTGLPTLVFRHPFPAAWRILLIMLRGQNGLSGVAERSAFKQLPQFSAACAGSLSRSVLMKLMPALVEQDFSGFGAAVYTLQNAMKDYFSSVQQTPRAARNSEKLLEFLNKQGIKGTGQTSWGPTTFAIMESEAQAQALKAQLLRHHLSCYAARHPPRYTSSAAGADASLDAAEKRDFLIVKGDNRGALLTPRNH